MDPMDIYSLLHRRNSEPQFGYYRREVLETIAADQNRTVESLGDAIFAIAAWLESMGNRGMIIRFFDDTLARDAVEQPEHLTAWDSILFCNKDGEWFARKRPHWKIAWGIRYGWETATGQAIIAAHHAEALAVHEQVLAYIESRKPGRKVETLAGKPVEDIPTIEVAYVAAVATVLYERYSNGFGRGFDSTAGILRWHYQELAFVARAELEYRTQSAPQPRSSKKKTAAAVEDWKNAAELLTAGTRHFFSSAFIEQAIHSATEPDLDVDFKHLPKLPLEQTPIRWLSDGEMVREFMGWVDAESDPASFDYEDKQLILRQLRAQFARIRGQKLDEELTLPGESGL